MIGAVSLVAGLASCGDSGSSSASCGVVVVRDVNAAEKTLANASARHYETTFYTRFSNVYELEFAQGDDGQLSGDEVSASAEVAFRVTNAGPRDAELGNEGCPGPLVVRIFYPVPAEAARDVAAQTHTTQSGPGGERLFWIEYRFTNTTGSNRLAPEASVTLTGTGAPAPITTSSKKAASALRSVLAGTPRDVFVADGFFKTDHALDGSAQCLLTGTGGALRLVAAWNGAGDPSDLLGDGCLSSAEDVFGTGDHYLPQG
jgi:hypothetical protein